MQPFYYPALHRLCHYPLDDNLHSYALGWVGHRERNLFHQRVL